MSIKHSLLALLVDEPRYGAQLKAEFELRTGGTWPLNVGQVYTTLARLERDELVEHDGEADGDGRYPYRLTPAGRHLVAAWWRTPIERDTAPRSELAMKLALAVAVPEVDVAGVVQAQRVSTLGELRDLTTLKRRQTSSPVDGDLAWSLVLEHLIFAAEAEIRWLDHVEFTLHRSSAARRSRTREPQRAPVPSEDLRS